MHLHHSTNKHAKTKLLVTLILTATIMVAEFVGGWWADSLALMADAGHMLTDLLALVVSFAAITFGAKPADPRRTYGYRRLEVLAALVNSLTLVGLSGSIIIEAVHRWFNPQTVHIPTMASVAAVGLVANLLGLWLLGHSHGAHNLNIRGAFLHVLGDTLSSVGVLLGAWVMYLTGFTRIDALLSGAIAIIIIISSVQLLQEVIDVLLEAAPKGINTEDVRQSMIALAGVQQVHDLHIWSITSGMPALSAHVVLTDPHADAQHILANIQQHLHHTYAIEHATLQIEYGLNQPCRSCA